MEFRGQFGWLHHAGRPLHRYQRRRGVAEMEERLTCTFPSRGLSAHLCYPPHPLPPFVLTPGLSPRTLAPLRPNTQAERASPPVDRRRALPMRVHLLHRASGVLAAQPEGREAGSVPTRTQGSRSGRCGTREQDCGGFGAGAGGGGC